MSEVTDTVSRAVRANYGIGADMVERLAANRPDTDIQVVRRTMTELSDEGAANEPTVVNLDDRMLTGPICANAMEVHLEPYEGKYRAGYRLKDQQDLLI